MIDDLHQQFNALDILDHLPDPMIWQYDWEFTTAPGRFTHYWDDEARRFFDLEGDIDMC